MKPLIQTIGIDARVAWKIGSREKRFLRLGYPDVVAFLQARCQRSGSALRRTNDKEVDVPRHGVFQIANVLDLMPPPNVEEATF